VPVVNITNNTQKINFKTTIQTLYWRERWEVCTWSEKKT
jgi:hypothetical protein